MNGATQPRSAGSTIKPFTYLLALERGDTPATIVPDVPTEFPTPTGPYRPENYRRRCQGPARYREALAYSLNIPRSESAPIARRRGDVPTTLAGVGRDDAGEWLDDYGLGLTIGNAEMRLIELANAVCDAGADGGVAAISTACSSDAFVAGGWPGLLAANGTRTQFNSRSQRQRGVDAQPLRDVAATLPPRGSLVAHRRHARGQRRAMFRALGRTRPLGFDFPVACKTGTSSDFRDNWALGSTPEFTGRRVGRQFRRLADARGLRRHGRGADHARCDANICAGVRHDVVRPRR